MVEKWKAIMSITPGNLKSARLLDEMKRYAPEEWKKIDRLLQEEWDVVTAIIEAAIVNSEAIDTIVDVFLSGLSADTTKLIT
jgi:hypothetical protein